MFKASLYKTVRGREMKSCPCCSQREKRHVYYPLTAFGTRQMGDGRILYQAWCVMCRAAAGALSRKKQGA